MHSSYLHLFLYLITASEAVNTTSKDANEASVNSKAALGSSESSSISEQAAWDAANSAWEAAASAAEAASAAGATSSGGSGTRPSTSIPHLATGTVIPPNREFMAILGDNKREPEVVSPLSTIEQAVRNVVGSQGGNDNNTLVPLLRELIDAVRSQSFSIGDDTILLASDRAKNKRGFAQDGAVAFAR